MICLAFWRTIKTTVYDRIYIAHYIFCVKFWFLTKVSGVCNQVMIFMCQLLFKNVKYFHTQINFNVFSSFCDLSTAIFFRTLVLFQLEFLANIGQCHCSNEIGCHKHNYNIQTMSITDVA